MGMTMETSQFFMAHLIFAAVSKSSYMISAKAAEKI